MFEQVKNGLRERTSVAIKDPTYLLADVEIIETYKVSNLNLTKLEKHIAFVENEGFLVFLPFPVSGCHVGIADGGAKWPIGKNSERRHPAD